MAELCWPILKSLWNRRYFKLKPDCLEAVVTRVTILKKFLQRIDFVPGESFTL